MKRSKQQRSRYLSFLKVGLGILVVAAVVLGVVARRRAESREPHYKTAVVTRQNIRITVSATGKIEGRNTVEVGSEVTGKLLRVFADYNDRVTKGQVLAEIDPEQLRASVDEMRAQVMVAEANIKTAEATVVEARQTRARVSEQAKQGLVAQKDIESSEAVAARAEASVASARANAELSRASLKSAVSKLGKTKIIAPIDGIVLARLIEPGQTVTAGFTTPILFKLAEDLTKLALHVDVDEADVGRVRDGLEAYFTVDAYPERQFPSRVLTLRNEPKTSQNVVTYEALLAVENTDRALRPGMTATATIASETRSNVVVVPNAALRFTPPARQPGTTSAVPRADEKRVYVLRGGALVATPVKTGASDGNVTELVDRSLDVGSEVVVDVAPEP